LSRSVVAWYLATQAASSAAVRIITAVPDLSAFTGVGPASSALRLCLNNKQAHQNKKRDHQSRKIGRKTYPDMGTRGLDPGRPEPPDGACDGPTVEPPAGRVLLGALASRASKVLCATEASWPRVLTPVDSAPASDADAATPTTV
jgi:hypothetical protein